MSKIPPSLADWRPWLAAAVALVLGLFRLDFQPMWLDEATTVRIATAPDAEFWRRTLGDQGFTGLYYLFMRLWSTLGSDEFVARLPSLAFTVLAVAVVSILVRRLFDRPDVALAAGLLTATNAFVIRYAQEARSYALALLLASVACLLLVVALERPSLRRWLAYGLALAASAYGHLFALFVVPAHVASMLGQRRFNGAVLGYALAGALVIPLLLSVVAFSPPREWIDPPTLRTLPRIASLIAGGIPEPAAPPLQLAAFGTAAVLGLILGLGQDRRWRFVVLLGWLVLPLAMAYLGSLLLQPMIVARYFLISTPPLMILASYGVMNLPGRWVRWAALAVLLATAAYGLWWLYFEFEKTAAPLARSFGTTT